MNRQDVKSAKESSIDMDSLQGCHSRGTDIERSSEVFRLFLGALGVLAVCALVS
jgi:hypothetical protein